MKVKVVGITAFVVLLFSAPASVLSQESAADETDAGSPVAVNHATDALSEWERFVYDRTARMTVPVSINGTSAIPFIVDTGAERTVIIRELAGQLGLPLLRSMRLATISGLVEADSYHITHLANGGFSASNFSAPALERRHMGIDGLIGIESLKDKVIIFDLAAQRMQVLPSRKAPRTSAAGKDAIVVRAKRKNGRLILSDAKVFGHRVNLIIDTGAQSSVGNMALRRLALSGGGLVDSVPGSVIDVSGTNILSEGSTIPEITIANFRLSNLSIAYVENYALEQLGLNERPAMLLGMDALAMFDRVEIDFGHRKVKFVIPVDVSGRTMRRSLSRRSGLKI